MNRPPSALLSIWTLSRTSKERILGLLKIGSFATHLYPGYVSR